MFIALTLSLLAVNFDDHWWPLQTIWISDEAPYFVGLHPNKIWGFIWDLNYLTFRLFIGINNWLETKTFYKFWRKKQNKNPSMQRVLEHDVTLLLIQRYQKYIFKNANKIFFCHVIPSSWKVIWSILWPFLYMFKTMFKNKCTC